MAAAFTRVHVGPTARYEQAVEEYQHAGFAPERCADVDGLVDAPAGTLYHFEKDRNGKSACSGACAKNWPPLLTKGKPKAGSGTRASKLGTTRRADGTTRMTYGGHPLYTFVVDKNKPGSTKGQEVDAFGAEWYVSDRTARR